MRLKIEKRKLDSIKPYEKNPRHNDNAVDSVANSIQEFGFRSPIIIDKKGVIIAGHTRYKAAQKLGLDEVPCVVASDLKPAQIKAYRLADNKTGELAEWDYDLLSIELAELKELDFDIELTGFDDDELSKLLDFEEEEPEIKETSFSYQEQYGVIVMCDSEEDQERIYSSLTEQGYTCKVVAT